MLNVVRTTLLISTLCRAMLHLFRASVIQVLSDPEYIDHITEMSSFPGHEILAKNISSCCYLDFVNLRIFPETVGWLLKLVSILCSWRPLVEPRCPCEYVVPSRAGWLGHHPVAETL